MPSVTIGPEFFAKAKNDYANWVFALLREALQNCCDAPGSKVVDFGFHYNAETDSTMLVFMNDGSPMTETELVQKLLCLGASGKDHQGTIGGFGKAKELLYLSHRHYTIFTGDLLVEGSGANYELKKVPYRHGTESIVMLDGDKTDDLTRNLELLASLTQWSGTLTCNGKVLATNLRKGSRRRDLDWATIYTNRTLCGLLIVRIGGLPMFIRSTNYSKGCVLVELNGASNKTLQSNRDGLLWQYSNELDEFIASLTVDKKSALRDESCEQYTKYDGYLLGNAKAAAEPAECSMGTAALVASESESGRSGRQTAGGIRTPVRTGVVGHQFVIRNITGMRVPAHYCPESFSGYSRRLLALWRKALAVTHQILGIEGTYSLGFTFTNEDEEAEYGATSELGHVYYISPAKIVKQGSGARSFANRWKLDAAGRWDIIATAIHECVHYQLGGGIHDENYAGKLTEDVGKCLRFRKLYGKG